MSGAVLMKHVHIQGLQRLLLFGFPSDAQSLESIPAVGQACYLSRAPGLAQIFVTTLSKACMHA